MIDSQEIAAFSDDFFPTRLREFQIPGAVFSVVGCGRTAFCQGYGLADLKGKRKADARTGVFRSASVSKLFTATAALQLWEQGKLDLHADVNQYLDFSLAATFAEPITAQHLLLHTAGLDERYIGIAADSPLRALPLGEYLKKRMPARVYPPGRYVSYSNHGMALLGYLVERISGVPFSKYVKNNIFTPLAMTRSSFEVTDVPAELLATGYARKKGELEPLAVDYLNIGPAASMVTSASDMARFMATQLNGGSLNGVRILKETTVEMMQRRHFSHHPNLPGRALGFHERLQNGRRAVAHAGGMRGFSSLLFLLPEEQVGFYVAYNVFDPRLYEELIGSFLDHFYPGAVPTGAGAANQTIHSRLQLKRISGHYLHNLYYCRSTFEKLITLGAHFKVSVEAENQLRLEFPGAFREPVQLVGTEPFFFEPRKGHVRAAFARDSRGDITHMFLGTGVLEKLAWYEHASLQKKLFLFFTLFFCLASLGWAAAWPAALVCTLNGAFLVGLGVIRRRVDSSRFLYGMPAAVKGLLWLPVLSTPLVLLPAFWLMWGELTQGAFAYTLSVTLVCLAFIPFLRYWNLLGFKY